MNIEKMIEIAREVGWEYADNDVGTGYSPLWKFGELVAAAEREACAKLCDAECNPTPNEGHITTYQSGGYITAEYLAAAIRARGQDV
jgi:hypothetical protein